MDETFHAPRLQRIRLLRRSGTQVWLVEVHGGGSDSFAVLKTIGDGDGVFAERSLRREIDWHVLAADASSGVVPVVAVLDDAGEGHPGLLLRFLDGQSVESLISDGRPVEITEVIDGLESLAFTLAELHAAGIVHGDVAPGNVVRPDDGTVSVDGGSSQSVLLTDFGSAGPVQGAGARDSPPPAASPLVRATHGFAAPEVEAGRAPTPAADAFGLGALGMAWLACVSWPSRDNRCARKGTSESSIGGDIGDGDAVAAITQWCASLMATDPALRPADLAAAGRGLRQATEGRYQGTRTAEFGPRPPAAEAPDLSSRGVGMRHVAVLLAAIAAVSAAVWPSGPHRAAMPVLHSPAAQQAQQGSVPSAKPCPRSEPAGELAPGRPRYADVLAVGCAQRVTWVDGVLTVRSLGRSKVAVRFGVGKVGDVVFLGKWDCEPRVTPRLYRPTSGEVIGYPEMPTDPGGKSVVSPWRSQTATVSGRATVYRDAEGCNRVRVE